MADFSPVGTHLPVRRDSLVEAKLAAPSARLDGGRDSIIAPQARDRMMELFEREQLPRDVNATLAGALSGDLQSQQLLFQAMKGFEGTAEELAMGYFLGHQVLEVQWVNDGGRHRRRWCRPASTAIQSTGMRRRGLFG